MTLVFPGGYDLYTSETPTIMDSSNDELMDEVASRWFPGHPVQVVTVPSGYSDNVHYKLVLPNGEKLHVKIPAAHSPVSAKTQNVSEAKCMQWAASVGLASPVEMRDETTGAFATKQIESSPVHCQFMSNKHLDLYMKFFRKLHGCKDTETMNQGEDRVFSLSCDLNDIIGSQRPHLISLEQKIQNFISAAPYEAVPIHNDVKCSNTIVDSHGDLHVFDWSMCRLGDNMEDLAFFAMSSDYGVKDLDRLLTIYDSCVEGTQKDNSTRHFRLLAHYLRYKIRGFAFYATTEEFHAKGHYLRQWLLQDMEILTIEQREAFGMTEAEHLSLIAEFLQE